MKKIRIIFSIIVLFIFFNDSMYGQQIFNSENSLKSIAIVLQINGENDHITNTKIYSYNIYDGIAKNLNETKPPKTTDILKIQVLDESNKIIFSGYFENPLNEHLESFEEDGTINKNIISNNKGYINIRFPINRNVQDIVVKCFSLKNNNDENLLSTLKFKIQ